MSALTLDDKGAAFVVHEEGYAGHPYWPGGASGVTLDYGYDLGQCSKEQYRADWEASLRTADLTLLEQAVGLKGAAAAEWLARHNTASLIRISKPAATTVFQMRTLPRYCAIAADDFPGIHDMPAPVRAAIVSLCVNRGGVPTLGKTGESREGESTDSDRYDSERSIRQIIQSKSDWSKIADLLTVMAAKDGPYALWPGDKAPNPGLRKRRLKEAALVKSAWTAAAA